MFSAIGTSLGVVSNLVTLSNASGASKGNNQYVDYFTTLWKLAELNFYPIGTKLVFSGHHITYSAPMFQAAQRSIANVVSGGAHSGDLVNLLPGIYYGLKSLDPYNNRCTRLFCLLAWRGILLLEETYRAEGDIATAQLLKRHGSLFEDFFTGRLVELWEYDIPDMSNHALKIFSDNHWMKGDEINFSFSTLNEGMMEALDIAVTNKAVDRVTAKKFDACKIHLRETVAVNIQAALDKAGKNVSVPAKVEYPVELLSAEKFTKHLTKNIKGKLWKWIKKPLVRQELPADSFTNDSEGPTILKRIGRLGVPIENSMDSKEAQSALMKWLTPAFVPPHKLIRQDRVMNRTDGYVGSVPRSILGSPQGPLIRQPSSVPTNPRNKEWGFQTPPRRDDEAAMFLLEEDLEHEDKLENEEKVEKGKKFEYVPLNTNQSQPLSDEE